MADNTKTKKNKKTVNSNKASSRQESLSVCAIILCAGLGSRTGLGYNKMLHYVGKKTVLELTLDRFSGSLVKSIVLVTAPDNYDQVKTLAANYKNVFICLGGKTRRDSVRAGLREIGFCDIVVIHDGARPYVSTNLINQTIISAKKHGSGILAVPTTDTIKEIKNETIVKSLCRSGLYNIQTPQSFNFEQIYDAYNKVQSECTDCSEVYSLAGYNPKIVQGEYENIKITSFTDFMRPATISSSIGTGFDVHKLVEGKKLILGGVEIEFHKGLEGHSDADVLVHAIMDALLSAADLPDIGVVFPNNKLVYKGISSMALLKEVHYMITKKGFNIHNISAVIMAQAPYLAHIIPNMRQNIANFLSIELERINISATTTEGLGIIGQSKGIASSATCLLIK